MKYVIKNVNLYQGLIDSTIIPCTNIYVENDRINDIECNCNNVKDGYEVIDGSGKYIMPGLINMHAHLFGSGKPSKVLGGGSLQKTVINMAKTEVGQKVLHKVMAGNLKKALLSGCTTVRAVGDFFYSDVKMKNDIAAGKVDGPRLLVSGYAITTPGGHGDGTFAKSSDNPEGLKNLVVENANNGVDLIKICVTGGVMDAKVKGEPGEVKMTYEQTKAVIDKAHELKYIVASHTESEKGVEIAVKAGVDTIEHGSLFSDEIAQLCKQQNTSFICTLSPALPLATFSPEKTKLNSLCVYNSKIVVDNMISGIEKALRYYIPVGLGTDCSCPYVTPYNMWREVYYFAKYLNVSNSFALYTATYQNAIILKMEKEIGSIEKGKIADMLILNSNPLEDLRALNDVYKVIARGKVYHDCSFKKDEEIEKMLDTLM